jgi:hypothetical protein
MSSSTSSGPQAALVGMPIANKANFSLSKRNRTPAKQYIPTHNTDPPTNQGMLAAVYSII